MPDAAALTDPFEAVPGAVFDDGVLQHVGNPFQEQRALARGIAVAPLAGRGIIAVSGEDRLSWLDSLTSQALAHLEPGRSTELLVLDPQGHIEYAASVVDDGERTWLIVDRAAAAGLLAWLTRMRFRLRVSVTDASDPQPGTPAYRVVGGTPAALAAHDSAAVWVDSWPGVETGGWAYAVTAPHPGSEREWAEAVVPLATYEQLAAEARAGTASVAGAIAADALRVAAWRPQRSEIDGKTLPHEADWLRTAVHLSKGCYRGQETVAKVHNLGHPPRRLVYLQLDGSDAVLPEPGALVFADDDEVGQITVAARHYEEGPVALAFVRRTAAPDARYSVRTPDGDVAATVEVIVPPHAGRTAAVPRLPRLSRRR